jgi:hypothetical protein
MRQLGHKTMIVLAALLWFAFSGSATAEGLRPMTARELQNVCAQFGQPTAIADSHVCGAYVRGFIEGSSAVIIQDASPASETFSQRALRTRLEGSKRWEPRYCLDTPTTLDALILQILVQADANPPGADQTAGELIEATLDRYHKCGREQADREHREP